MFIQLDVSTEELYTVRSYSLKQNIPISNVFKQLSYDKVRYLNTIKNLFDLDQ